MMAYALQLSSNPKVAGSNSDVNIDLMLHQRNITLSQTEIGVN